jgi:hypothetical protein
VVRRVDGHQRNSKLGNRGRGCGAAVHDDEGAAMSTRSGQIIDFFKSYGAQVELGTHVETSENRSFGQPGCDNPKPITAYEIQEYRIHLGPQSWILRIYDRKLVELFRQETNLCAGSDDDESSVEPELDWVIEQIKKALPEKWFEYEYRKTGVKLVGEHTLQKVQP